MLRHPDRTGTCSTEPTQTFSPGCLLDSQDKVGHGAVAVFSDETRQQNSRKITLANRKQESRAYTGLSGETCLLFLNTTLD